MNFPTARIHVNYEFVFNFLKTLLVLICLNLSLLVNQRTCGIPSSDKLALITKTCPCNIQQYFTAVKMLIFR